MKTMKTLSRRMAALFLVVVVGLTALAPAASAAAIQLPSLPKDKCVVDDAGVLSDSTTTELETINAQLSASCNGAQIGVLTVDYTGSATTEDYATAAFNAWGIGSASKNNGVLILLVMQSAQYADGDYYLTYGDGFRSTMLADQASTLVQTMEDDFAAKEVRRRRPHLRHQCGKHHCGGLWRQPERCHHFSRRKCSPEPQPSGTRLFGKHHRRAF